MSISKKISLSLIVSSNVLFSTTYAGSNTNTLFYCKTTKGRQIEIVKRKSHVIYSYGKNLNKPELTLKKKMSDVQIYRGPYKDGKIFQITIPNKQYAYSIYSGNTANGSFNYLSVTKNDTEIAQIECQDSTVKTIK